jgi:hypothetical protein
MKRISNKTKKSDEPINEVLNQLTINYGSIIIPEKPSSSIIGTIKKNINLTNKYVDFDELCDICLNNAFIPCFSTGKKSVDYIKSNIIGVDFDDYPVEKCKNLIKILNNEDIYPNIIYSTLSDNPKSNNRRFRMIFILDKFIEDKNKMNSIKRNFISKLDGDTQAQDLTRMFFPGKKILYLDTKHANSVDIFSDRFAQNIDSDNIILQKLNKEKNINICDAKNQEGKTTTDNDRHLLDVDIDDLKKHVLIFKDFFDDDKIKFSYKYLQIIVSNLRFIKGGTEIYKKRIEYINSIGGALYYGDKRTEPYRRTTFGKELYLPVHYNMIDTYKGGCISFANEKHPRDEHYGNIIKYYYNNIIIKDAYFKYHNTDTYPFTLSEAEKVLKDCYSISKEQDYYPELVRDVFNKIQVKKTKCKKNEKPIIILKFPTGLGKSTCYLNDDELSRCVIAYATHNLKSEKSQSFKTTFKMTIPIPIFSDETLNRYISAVSGINNQLINIGKIIYNISQGINPIADKNIDINITQEDMNIAHQYNDYYQSFNTDNLILTTHDMVTYNSYLTNNKDLIVYDEDPLSSIIKRGTTYEAFSKYKNSNYMIKPSYINEHNELMNIIKEIDDYEDNTVIDNRKRILSNSLFVYLMSMGDYDTIKIFTADYIFKVVEEKKIFGKIVKLKSYHYINMHNLPENERIIIMSATINTNLYKMLYGDRVKIVDCPYIEHDSNISSTTTQYTDYTFTRASLFVKNKTDNKINYLTKIINDDHKIITFKEATPTSLNPTPDNPIFSDDQFKVNGVYHDIYFNNCSGFDNIKGQNLDVVGTFYLHASTYMFYAYFMHLKIKFEDYKKRKYENKYFIMNMFCFDNRLIDDIIYEDIISMQEQASGRNRSLRCTNIITNVYSNIPNYRYENIVIT